MKKVVILQHRLLHYRVGFFDMLRERCLSEGIQLELVHGQPSLQEMVKIDTGELPWAYKVKNYFFTIFGKDMLWQPFPKRHNDADLIIIMQESRILSNYILLLGRIFRSRNVAYWGHGKNFQSNSESGIREKWKSLLLTHVDWWFAYTEMTVDLLEKSGYKSNKITCLNNAIDTTSFKQDLAYWREHEIVVERRQLSIPDSHIVGIYCGSLYPEKRLDLMLEAADIIVERNENFSLIVVGDGPSKSYLEEMARTRSWLHIVGVKRGKEKALYFRMASVILNPGLVGLHIVDAFCSGLVMVTTHTARHSPEVAYLRDQVNGIYASDDPEGYADAVLDLLADNEKLKRMNQAALADSNFYTLENMVTRFADGIKRAINA